MTAALTSVGVQQVSITIGSGATSNTATITAVGSGAFIIWQGQSTTDSTTGVSSLARIELTNTTTVTATRDTSSTDTITINAVIVDGDTTNLVKSVQSGTTTIATSSATGTSTITAVTNANTAIFYLGQSTNAVANYFRNDCAVALSGTTVTASRSTSGTTSADIVGWCVVEFQGTALNSSTQNVSIASPASGTSATATITSVTTANTMLAYGGCIPVNSGSGNKDFTRLSLASATSVQIDYNTAPFLTTGATKGVVIEFVSGILAQTIQRNTTTITTATSNTATITSAAITQTVASLLGNTTTETVFNPSTTFHRLTQTNATTLTETVGASATGTGSWEVITFNPASAAVASASGFNPYFSRFIGRIDGMAGSV